jgi:hypothetical protein
VLRRVSALVSMTLTGAAAHRSAAPSAKAVVGRIDIPPPRRGASVRPATFHDTKRMR